MSTPLPKLSYVLLSHNREKYIRAAIESAFAQDYEGELEYIFSDDCSTDRTFEIIKECVAEYKGNRRVVVTQTPRNLHLAGNTNHAVQFVESDWIVRADDDDISAVDRCSIVGRAIADNPGCSYVYTLFEQFTDKSAESIRERSTLKLSSPLEIEKHNVLSGKHHFWDEFNKQHTLHQVWSTHHFRKFGPLPIDGYWVDDVISNMRCCVLGFGVKVHAITVYIRKGSCNMSTGETHNPTNYSQIIKLEQFNDKYFNTTLAPMMALQKDLLAYLKDNSMQGADDFLAELEQEMQNRRMLCTFWRKGVFNRILVSRKVGYKGLFCALRCLPLPIYAGILALYRKLTGKA